MDGETKPGMAPIISTENQSESTSTKIEKFQAQSSVALVPTMHNLLSEESEIQGSIKTVPEEDLQLSQMVVSGTKEAEPPRICL